MLAIATDTAVLLLTGFVLQGHLYELHQKASLTRISSISVWSSSIHPYSPFLWLMCLSGRPFVEDGTHIFFNGFCVSSRVRLLPPCCVLSSVTFIISVVSTNDRPLSVRTKDRAEDYHETGREQHYRNVTATCAHSTLYRKAWCIFTKWLTSTDKHTRIRTHKIIENKCFSDLVYILMLKYYFKRIWKVFFMCHCLSRGVCYFSQRYHWMN